MHSLKEERNTGKKGDKEGRKFLSYPQVSFHQDPGKAAPDFRNNILTCVKEPRLFFINTDKQKTFLPQTAL
jgi:hypothetical protein